MVTAIKFAAVSAIFLLPFAYPSSALSRIWSLSYQEAVWMCSTGDHQACDVMYRLPRWLALRCRRKQPTCSNNAGAASRSLAHDLSSGQTSGFGSSLLHGELVQGQASRSSTGFCLFF